jgi:hypothetical protein
MEDEFKNPIYLLTCNKSLCHTELSYGAGDFFAKWANRKRRKDQMFKKDKRMWGSPALKPNYDAVIIGGGVHGFATAYYLAKNHGMRNIAVIEKRYVGFGGADRNTAIVRANQRTKENLPLYDEGLKLWPQLTRELDFNLMFNNCGNLNLAHSEAASASLVLLYAPLGNRRIRQPISGHPENDQVMKGSNQVKINRTGPVLVKNGCKHVESICGNAYRFFNYAEICP